MSVNIVNNDGSLLRVAGGTLYADTPIGAIQAYGGTTAPSGWLICDGRALSKTEYVELFNAIGNNYGGSGSTFNIPSLTQLKQDYTVKTQLDTWTSNLEDGSESHTITINNDGSYYFEVVLSNTALGKQGNNISITIDNKIVSTWGYIGTGALLLNKTLFLKKGTYTITHICQTAGISGTSVVTVYSTRNEPVCTYIIKAKQVAIPADFRVAVDDVLSEFAKPISLQSANNSIIMYDKSKVVGSIVTVCASITVPSGNHLVKENAIVNIPNYGTNSIGYILPCIYRNTGNGIEESSFAYITPSGNLFPYYTRTEYNEIRINASYSSKV